METRRKINKVDRSKARLISGPDDSRDFVDAANTECVAMVWELTKELWSLRGDKSAEQRLHRNVAVLKKQ